MLNIHGAPVFGLVSLLLGLMLVACDDGEPAGCDDSTCAEECHRLGYEQGQCTNAFCLCGGGNPDGDVDVDGDADVDGDSEVDGDSDGDGDSVSSVLAVKARLLEYITQLPSRTEKRIISGQFTDTERSAIAKYYDLIDDLHRETGAWVGILGTMYTNPSGYDDIVHDRTRVNQLLINYWNQGGFVMITWSPTNPWVDDPDCFTGPYEGTGERGYCPAVDLTEVSTEGTDINLEYRAELDRIADALEQLQDAGVVVLWRTMNELNGGWFWYGSEAHPGDPMPTVDLWRYNYAYLTEERHLDNLIWIYGAANMIEPPANFYYPGDDYVDIVGQSCYTDDINCQGYAALTELEKPFVFSEMGPNFSREPDGSFDWLDFRDAVRSRYPLAAYWQAWHDWTEVRMSIVSNTNARDLLDDPLVVNRGDLAIELPRDPGPVVDLTPDPPDCYRKNAGVRLNFSEDRIADMSVWRPLSGKWFIKRSEGRKRTLYWGNVHKRDIPVPADYDGDEIADLALWRPDVGFWWIRGSSGGPDIRRWPGYESDDQPVPGDYDGDGSADLAVWRPSAGEWRIYGSLDDYSKVAIFSGWGTEDVPVPGDYDGDGTTDLAIWRPSSSRWLIKRSSDGFTMDRYHGNSTDILVPGDYDGDGMTDIGIWRPSNGRWSIYSLQLDRNIIDLYFGDESDIPAPGDYDGDGAVDIAVWRPSTNRWYVEGDDMADAVEWGNGLLDCPL